VKGILADIHLRGPIDALVREMQAEPWAELWQDLGLRLFHFEDVGLAPTSTDLEIWQRCQTEQLIFITNNRNQDSPDSLEATIRQHNAPDCLPVFTVGDLDKFRKSRPYATRVLERLYEYLIDLDNVRGSGRLFLP
jgi:predicted nuclease of predicted toxin-antitoxin system